MINPSFLHTSLLCLSLTLVSCSSAQKREDFASLATSDLEAVNEYQSTQKNAEASLTDTRYLTDLINDPQLDELIKQALQANPNLQKMQLTLQASLWGLRSQEARSLPSVEAGFSGSQAEGNDINYRADVSLRWEADLWQKLALSEQANTWTGSRRRRNISGSTFFSESQVGRVQDLPKPSLILQ